MLLLLCVCLEDIFLLVNYFIDKYCNDVLQDIYGLSEMVCVDLFNYVWLGNVRMLENVIVCSMIMQEKDGLFKYIIFEQDELNLGVLEIVLENFFFLLFDLQYEGLLEVWVVNYERYLIEIVLDMYQGNIVVVVCSFNVFCIMLQYKV